MSLCIGLRGFQRRSSHLLSHISLHLKCCYGCPTRFPEALISSSTLRMGTSVAYSRFLTLRRHPLSTCARLRDNSLYDMLTQNQLDFCEFLLHKQADPFLEDRTNLHGKLTLAGRSIELISRSSAFDIAWNKIFSGKASIDMRARLQALFPKTDRLDKRGISKLHQGILGLRHVNLEKELRFYPRLLSIKRTQMVGLRYLGLHGEEISVPSSCLPSTELMLKHRLKGK
ncbi:uncharacterized protein BDW70DRAFT_39334 [Aspergillus foveolatus]|uniref:uncharacterized protein n=1 Tax=Aspergillus foveolatus TaxID=210207 RepID=UPI003CCDD91C